MRNSASEIPSLSVVMATYNRETTLPLAIESILAQSFGDFEFIIVDDGSADSTSDILARYAQWDSRIRVVRNSENLYIARAVNKGIAMARAPYIARMDDDDISLPERFSLQYKHIRNNPEIDVCGGAAFVMGQDYILSHPGESEAIRAGTLFRSSFVNSTTIIRKSLLDKIGGYPRLFVEDYYLWIQLLLRRDVVFSNINNVILNYRINQGQNIAKTENAVRNFQGEMLAVVLGEVVTDFELDCHTFMRHLGYPGGRKALAALNTEQKGLLALWCKKLFACNTNRGLLDSTSLYAEMIRHFPDFNEY